MNNRNNIPRFEYGFYTDSRTECFKKFGDIFSLPIISDPYKEILQHYLKGNILDIGAGKDTPLLNFVKGKLNNGRYYSLDTDPQGTFDFNDIDEIPDDMYFSLITANQFFEHLNIEEAITLMYKASLHLNPGGKLIATVPNISHPNRYFADITHKTFWNYNGFYMVFKYANLEVTEIARYSKKHPKGIMEKLLAKYITRIYRMDWCDSILIAGTKSGKRASQ